MNDALGALMDAGSDYDIQVYGYPCSSFALHRSSSTYYAKWSASESRRDAWVCAEATTATGAVVALRRELQRRMEDNEVADEARAIELGYERHPS